MASRTSDRNQDLPSGLTAVTMRAACDRAFRSALLADPHLAIRDSFGVLLPATLRLRFVEKAGDVDLLVVLPDLLDDAPLASDELERVAGTGCALRALPEWPGGALVVPA